MAAHHAPDHHEVGRFPTILGPCYRLSSPVRCPTCQADTPSTSRFCPECGASLDARAASNAPTIDSGSSPSYVTRVFMPSNAAPNSGAAPPPKPSTPQAPPSFSSLSSSSFLHGLFSPGQFLAGRYRIVSLLGKGGMGEVYRADDLTLGVSVALKFLPESITAEGARLERFRAEVRTTRQISHPNVCRVYDIGEFEGRPYLSMEYVDGEDLASLLRRIGRLPHDKAVQIARQVCAGLAVAHDMGIVHRDLKPANIMLDGRGQARLMDFGVAGYAADLAAKGDITAGTPVYMAPEQLAGESVTARSDIYSLGLVLYELFTGKSAWAERASSLAELRRLHESSRPTSARSLVMDLDPAVERVIERCLEHDPANRPSSAIAVAAALPGGDPLAAALAAGETPSPEMVAQAGKVGAMSRRNATALLACVVIALIGVLVMSSLTGLLSKVKPQIPPAVLASKAREIASTLGYPDKPADESFGYMIPSGYYPWLRKEAKAAVEAADRDWPSLLADPFSPSLLFFYRSSPTELRPVPIWQPFVSYDDPPQIYAGSVRALFDQNARLVRFEAIPPRTHPEPAADEPPATPRTPDWSAIFALAGLDLAAFKQVAPVWTPLVASDTRTAWTGELPTKAPIPIRVEAATERGKIVSFRIVYPWTSPDRSVRTSDELATKVFNTINLSLFLAALVGGSYLAWRNIRAGRNDRRGATIVTLFIFAVTWMGLCLGPDRFQNIFSPTMINSPLGRAISLAMMCWLFYTALEPVLRKLWPKSMISWARLLAGRFRDPLVGGDVLIGVAAGLLLMLLLRVAFALPGWLGSVPAVPPTGTMEALRGPRAIVSWLSTGAGGAVTISMLFALLLIGARVVIRKNVAAIIVFAVIVFVFQMAAFEFYKPATLPSIVVSALITFLLVRVGMLALTICFFVCNAICSLPITIDLGSWHAGQTVAMIFAAMALALYGYLTALGGQKVIVVDLFDARR